MTPSNDGDAPTRIRQVGGGDAQPTSSASSTDATRISGTGGYAPTVGGYAPATSVLNPTIVRPVGPQIETAAWVYCKKGIRKGQLTQFKQARNEFGRDPNNDWVLEDAYAGAHHGAILLEGTEWIIFDFAAKNGTFINAQRMGKETPTPTTLKDGDIITVGDSEFVFKCL